MTNSQDSSSNNIPDDGWLDYVEAMKKSRTRTNEMSEFTTEIVPETNELVKFMPDECPMCDKETGFCISHEMVTRRELVVREEKPPMFIYDPFGHGSLLEQAVEYIVKKAMLGQPINLNYLSTASRMLNEIINREMMLMGIVINEKFLFESMNEYGSGGWMRVYDTTGKEYMRWSI